MFRKILKFFIGILLIPFILLILFQKKDLSYKELNETYAVAPSKFLKMDGMSIHYRIQGKGTPLILIHGTGAALFTWDKWADSLSQYYQVITMDLPGFGLTGPSPEHEYSMRNYVDFIDHFILETDIETPFILGGNSLGGGIAWQYALRHPDKVSQLLLLSPSESPAREKNFNILTWLSPSKIPGLNQLLYGIDTKLLVTLAMKNAYENDELISPEKSRLYYQLSLREGNREAFLKRMEASVNDPQLDPNEVKTPSLILWGENDNVLPIQQLEGFKKMPNASIITFLGVGHSPQEEIPTESVNHAIQYLQNFSKE